MHTSTARFNGNLFSRFTDDVFAWTNRIQDIPITHLLTHIVSKYGVLVYLCCRNAERVCWVCSVCDITLQYC